MTPVPVVVSNGRQTFYGVQSWESPEDPPVVQANGRRWERSVWVAQGWTVERDNTPGGTT